LVATEGLFGSSTHMAAACSPILLIFLLPLETDREAFEAKTSNSKKLNKGMEKIGVCFLCYA